MFVGGHLLRGNGRLCSGHSRLMERLGRGAGCQAVVTGGPCVAGKRAPFCSLFIAVNWEGCSGGLELPGCCLCLVLGSPEGEGSALFIGGVLSLCC